MFNPPKSYLFTEDDIVLSQLTHTFMEATIWLAEGMSDQIATFDLFVREMPAHRNYLVAGGLEEFLQQLKNWHYNEEHIAYLKRSRLINEEFAEYLRDFKFTGTIEALPEGTVFFPYEPIVRITAPLIQAALLETYAMATFGANTMFMSKAARLKTAAKGKFIVSIGTLRPHSLDAGSKACRAAHILDIEIGATPYAGKKYNFPIPKYVVNAQHLFIKSFPTELDAFRAMARYSDNYCSFMIDTYDFEQGLENAITVAQEMEAQGKRLTGVMIDSGDPITRSRYVRSRLDEADLPHTNVTVISNVDEHKISQFADLDLPITRAASVTQYETLLDSPKIEIVYKLAEIIKGAEVLPTAKLTEGKLSYPGRKQIFRVLEDGKLSHDTIALENERVPGVPLLQTVVQEGRVIYNFPDVDGLREYVQEQLLLLPSRLLDLEKDQPYEVKISNEILGILETLKSKHQNNG